MRMISDCLAMTFLLIIPTVDYFGIREVDSDRYLEGFLNYFR